jgi:hypothetical protein
MEAAAELTLDVVPGDGSNEHGTISMTWTREDLEKLLEAAKGDNVVLTFDRDELAAVLADVEAHGLRTRAAVFAVAAVGALGSGASIANAMIPGANQDGGAGTATPTAVTSDTSQAALQARSEALNVRYGLGSSATDSMVTDASTGGYATPSQSDQAAAALQARSEALNAQYGLAGAPSESTVTDASTSGYVAPKQDEAQSALQARSQALNEQYGLGAQSDPAVKALEARGEAMNAAYGLGSSASDSIVTDASTGGGYAAPATSDGGFSIQAPSTDSAALAGAALGAALLTIAGASFAARRTSQPRPA